MVKSPKQEQRKTVWRGISLKADSRPSSTQSQDSSVSWERQPLSPLSQQEFPNSTKTPPHTPTTFEDHQHEHHSNLSISPTNSTSVSSSKSSSKSSSRRKTKLAELGSLTKMPSESESTSTTPPSHKKSKEKRSANLGSLTKPYEQSEKLARRELERKERKEREKLERKARKEQEKLDKERKEQQKKELKDQERLEKERKEQQKKELKEKVKETKLLKEKERKDRKSKTKSSIFSLSSKSSTPPPLEIIHTINPNLPTDNDESPKSPVERRSILSFGGPNTSHMDITVDESTTITTVTSETTADVVDDNVTDDSGSEEFVDFVDSHASIHSGHSSRISGSTPQESTSMYSGQRETSLVNSDPSTIVMPSALQPRPQQRAPKLLDHSSDQNATNNTQVGKQQNPSTPNGGNHSMLYILNSLQDAGRNIGDDDLLDELTANKMEETQQHSLAYFSHHIDNTPEQQFDQHIQALEIVANGTAASLPPSEPLPPLPTDQQPHRQSSSTDSHSITSQHHQLHSSTGRWSISSRISHNSSISNSSYDTVSQSETRHLLPGHDIQHNYGHQHHSVRSSSYGITAISEEEFITATIAPKSPIPGSLTIETAPPTDESLRKQHDNDGNNILDSPIDKYINCSHGDNHGNNSSGSGNSSQNETSDDQHDSDSVSFESTDIPDPFLFPSEESVNEKQLDSSPQKPDSDTLDHRPMNSNHGLVEAPPHTNIDISTKNQPPMQNHKPTTATSSPASITDKDKKLMEEALKARTTENMAGRQVPVMQVNIGGHDLSTQSTVNHPVLLAPMSAVIESTNPSLILESNDIATITATTTREPCQQSTAIDISPTTNEATLLSPRISSLPSSSDTSLVESSALVESPATTIPTESTSADKFMDPTSKRTITGSSDTITATITTQPEMGVRANFLKPREQEEADQPIRQGMNYLFSNKFTKALAIFRSKAESEPLHAHGLGSMLFLKAMMTYNESDVDAAMDTLTQAYTMASTQVDLSEENLSFDDTFSSQFSSLIASANVDDGRPSLPKFKSNGVLRAHVIMAESCLLMSILQLTQETMTGYLKCGLNLRKACTEYTLVWKEYQEMGNQVSEHMDQDTALSVQFGVGTLHILLSSLPEKIINIFSGLSWKTNKNLGFKLLKAVMIGKGTRSSFGSLILLSYYSLLSSSVPSLYAQESIQPTIECLVEAQKSHPKSCFFLYYAARISRVARNVSLSTQSFTMATSSTRRAAWAEVAMKHMVAYEVGLNHAMQLDWDTSAAYFEQLCCARDWSPAFCQYFVGACHEMLGQRQEAKDAFDEVTVISHQQHHRKSLLDNYVQVRVERYQYQDYRDMDTCLPGLELLLLLNAFASMEDTYLQRCLDMIEETCQLIEIDDDDDYDDDMDKGNNHGDQDGVIGNVSDFNDKATKSITSYGTLLLLKSAVLNALSRYNECIPLLDWIMAKRHHMESEEWLLPFVYWETGVTHWGLGNQRKSRHLWQLALSCTKYDFEFRMASRIHLALEKCDELGIMKPADSTAIGRKRT